MTVIDLESEAAQHPAGQLHDRVVCPHCVRDRQLNPEPFLARCEGSCDGQITPHEITGASSGDCVFCGHDRWF